MHDPQALTLAFLDSHAAEAARVVETLPYDEAAALLGEIPARSGAPLLAELLPALAARLLGQLDDANALALLAAMSTVPRVAILRQVAEPRRSTLIAGLPTVAALAARLLLGFPEDSVGAWVDPEAVTVARDARVDDALTRVRQSGAALSDVHVLDEARRLSGIVPLHVLVRAHAGAVVATLARKPVAVVPAMMPLGSAATLRAWTDSPVLPVVDARHRMIGVLHHATLVRIEADRRRRASARAYASGAAALANAYWGVVSGLVQGTLGVLSPVKRVLPEE